MIVSIYDRFQTFKIFYSLKVIISTIRSELFPVSLMVSKYFILFWFTSKPNSFAALIKQFVLSGHSCRVFPIITISSTSNSRTILLEKISIIKRYGTDPTTVLNILVKRTNDNTSPRSGHFQSSNIHHFRILHYTMYAYYTL